MATYIYQIEAGSKRSGRWERQMIGPKYAAYQNLKAAREQAAAWLAHIGKRGRGSDVLGLHPSQASIKLTICGQYTEGGNNYRDNPPEFGKALLEVILDDFSALAQKAIDRMQAAEKAALAAAESEINAVNASLSEALGRPVARPIHLVFDALPSPEGARFIEAEDETGKSIKVGEWVERPDGLVALVIPA